MLIKKKQKKNNKVFINCLLIEKYYNDGYTITGDLQI